MDSPVVLNLVPSNEDDEPILLDAEQRRHLAPRLREADRLKEERDRLSEEVRELREEVRRLHDENRRMKAAPPFWAATDRTAEAGGVSTSRVIYRRSVRPREPRAKPVGYSPRSGLLSSAGPRQFERGGGAGVARGTPTAQAGRSRSPRAGCLLEKCPRSGGSP